MGKDTAEGGTGDIQRPVDENAAAHDPNQQPATVIFLDSTKHIFYVPKKAEGAELFNKVVTFLGLNEKDYFALSFTDGDGNRHWIYEDKRIGKQLKGHPWNFNFEVKFYPLDPATLNDDITRHLLSLQVRRDIATGKLPATLATHALLGSYVAQSVRGDYEPSAQYVDFLRSCRLAPVPNETLYEKVEELHKQHKGETPGEAELHYLENAKKLSMYGVHLFPGKDGKGVPVQIGVCAHGINIYCDQLIANHFLWQNIIKIAYRRNVFIIKVKPGGAEKNEWTAAFKLPDHDAAKRVWKCAVEHHTFFRLIQPEEKPHKGLFRWGSAKFRYQGRTQFQSKMAAQMFNSLPVQRSQSARMPRDDDRVPIPASKNQTLPLNYSDDGTSKESGWNSSQMSSPGKTYAMQLTETTQRTETNALRNGAEVGRTAYLGDSSGKLHDGTRPSATVTTTTITTTAAITTATATTAATTVTTSAASGQSFDPKAAPAQFSSFRFSPYSAQITRGAAQSVDQLPDTVAQPQYVPADTSSHGPGILGLQKEHEIQLLPIQDKAVVYHPGHYEEEAAGNRRGPLREPPIEPGDDFVLIHKPKLGAAGKIFHESGSETDILVKEEDIETYPIRYFANIYHSGFSRFNGGNKDFDVFEHEKCLGTVDVVDKRKVNKKKYPKSEKFTGQISRTERSMELPTEPLRSYAYVYNQGFYDIVDPSQTDIDEKGNQRYWLRGYKKPEKPMIKPSIKAQETEVKGRTESYRVEKDGTKMVNGDRPVGGFVTEREDKTKKTAHIYLKQGPYERRVANDNHTVVTKETVQREADFEEAKPARTGVEATTSAAGGGADGVAKTFDSTQPKYTYRLFTRATHEGTEEIVEKNRIRPEAYGLPSTSYEGPLHNVKREEELPASPIREHAAVYHPGTSVVKVKKRRKFLSRKENEKGASSETSSDDEGSPVAVPKRTAILHVSGSDKNDTTVATDSVEKRPNGEEIITKHITREVEETEYPNDGKAGVSEGQGKGKAVLYLREGESKPASTEAAKMPGVVLKRTEESEIAHTAVPTYSVLAVTKSANEPIKVKPAVPPKKPLSEYAEDNTPPLENLSRTDEITFQPLYSAVKGTSYQVTRGLRSSYKAFKRATLGGTVEFVAKENVDPESYKIERTEYRGPLENTVPAKELQFAPIQEHAAVYHPGNSYVKSRKSRKPRKAAKLQEAEEPHVSDTKKTASLHLKKDDYGTGAGVEEKEKTERRGFFSKWGTGNVTTESIPHDSYSSRQQTGYTAKIVPKVPERKDKKERLERKKRPFRYRSHAGDVEIVEKSHVKPESYKLTTVPYDGPLRHLEYGGEELSFTPLQEHSAAYHSGISYKKAKRVRESSSESSASRSSSSSSTSSSSSSSDTVEKYTETKKKAVLYVRPDDKLRESNTAAAADSGHDEGFLSFWRRSGRSEKESRQSDVKKEKPETLPKPRLNRQQYTVLEESSASSETSPYSQGVSTTSLKGSEYEPKGDLYGESESTKMSARLYLRDEPTAVSESVKESNKRGKFDPFSFWRSTEEESKASSKKPVTVAAPTSISNEGESSRLSHEEQPDVGSTAESKKKAIIYVNDTARFPEPEVSKLGRSKDAKEEPLVRGQETPSAQEGPNTETKKSALIYLRDGSKPSEGEPIKPHSPAGSASRETATAVTTSTQQISAAADHTSLKEEMPYQPLRAEVSLQQVAPDTTKDSKLNEASRIISGTTNVSAVEESSSKRAEDTGYIARITAKPQAVSSDTVLEEVSDESGKGKTPEESMASSFKLRGVHLRGPPSDSEEAVNAAVHGSSKVKSLPRDESAAVAGKEIKLTEQRTEITDTEEITTGKKVAVLRIRDEKLIESDVGGRGSKKDESKSSGGSGSFFSSFWRSSSRSKDGDEQLKKQSKTTQGETHGTVTVTSPSDELQYKTLRAKIDVYNTGYKKEEPTTGATEGQISQGYVPVYDFSYVPNFEAPAIEGDAGKKPATEDTEKDAAEARGWGGSTLRRLFGYKSRDTEEYYDAPAPPEDQVVNNEDRHSAADAGQQPAKEKAFVSELSWEKSDISKTARSEESQRTEPRTPETEDSSLVYRDATSGGETSDEPYKFTQTPPDVPVSVVHPTDSKGPRGFVEQIKRQVTQVVAKASPSSEKKKKLKKEKKRSKKGASSRGSETSSASETESASHHDSSLAANQPKESTNKSEVVSTLPYEEAKLEEGRVLLEKRTDETYHLKGARAVPAFDSTNAADAPHQTIQSWQETTTGPETVVTELDHQGNVVKKTIKTQQVKHTVQRQTYQTYGVPGQNGDTGVHVVETTQKSITPIGEKNVTSTQTPIVETRSHTLAYESKGAGTDATNGNDYSDIPGELISSRTITQGNRTIETITYKTEKNGVIETHVEHRVTIQSGDNIDHDAELSQAILEATNMNPDMTVEKIEVKQESQC